MGSPTLIAYLVLILWIPISFFGMSLARPSIAVAGLMVGALMFLPERVAFDLPGMPPIGKQEIASLGLLLACLSRYSGRLVGARPGRGLEVLVLVLMLAGVGTAVTNGDVLVFGPTVLPSLEPYEAISMGIRDLIRYGLPFFIGRAFYRRPSDLRDLLLVLIAAGVIYSFFILFELRMSPNLHRWIYGFGQHGFGQHVRWGGYRPMVFMAGGLAIALFMANVVTAAFLMFRLRVPILRMPAGIVAGYLAVILVLCKSFASMAYALVTVPLVLFFRARTQMTVAALLAVLVFTFPLSRSFDLFPTEWLVSVASEVNEDRADSLDFRFRNEDMLMDRANERLVFGWGGFRRSRVFHETRGNDLSITDGFWIITMGRRGMLGYLAIFGLLLWPIIRAYLVRDRFSKKRDSRIVGGFALILAISCVDLLPNGMFTNIIVFLSGALAGVVGEAASKSLGGGSKRAARSGRHESVRAKTPAEQGSAMGRWVSGAAFSAPRG